MPLCKNCQAELAGKFCPECGQKADTRRITTREMFSDLLHKLLPWDRGFLFTVRGVVTRPGHMVRDYLDGKRVLYNKPVNFLFVIVAISVIFFSQQEFMEAMGTGAEQAAQPPILKKITDTVFSNISVIVLGLVPFLALASKWLHRKAGINYAEHLVLSTYLMAGTSLISIPLSAFVKLIGVKTAYSYGLFYVQIAVSLAYFTWGNIQFFQPRRLLAGGLKAILVFLIGYVLYILVIGLLMSLILVVYMLIKGKT